MNVSSSASGIAPRGAMGGSGARSTTPCASVTAAAAVSRAVGGKVARIPQRWDLDAAAAPVETRSVTAAHCRTPASQWPRVSGQCRWGQRSTTARTGPQPGKGPGLTEEHHSERLIGDVPERATGCQQ